MKKEACMKTLGFGAALCTVLVLSLGAQEGSGGSASTMLNVNNYSKLFLNGNGSAVSSKYLRVASSEDKTRLRGLGGDFDVIDTPLEIALLSTCTGVMDIRPPEAMAILPANDPKQSDLKLGTAVYMDMQVARFTGGDPAPYAAALKFITDRGNVSEAEIKVFMRDGIRSAVEAEFSKRGKDGVVPSEVYADWESRGFARDTGNKPVNGTELVIKTLTNFFLNPTQDNYVRVRGIVARIGGQDFIHDPLYNTIDKALDNIIIFISPALKQKLDIEFNVIDSIATHSKQPDDPAFEVFSIPYAVGNGR
jgi:hypothetical protein